jgi:hypothetical protein
MEDGDIRLICSALEQSWLKHPNYSFAQFVDKVILKGRVTSSIMHITDQELLDQLNR